MSLQPSYCLNCGGGVSNGGGRGRGEGKVSLQPSYCLNCGGEGVSNGGGRGRLGRGRQGEVGGRQGVTSTILLPELWGKLLSARSGNIK